ncbi:MAG: hypothetical protein WEB59_10130 [Thermoanaerobaculia bacterium]
MIRRIRRRLFAIAAAGIVVAFALGRAPGVSLTICAAVVVSSFLALERLIARLAPGREKPGWRTLVPLLLVTVGSFALLGVVLWQWKGFHPVAGAVGLSVAVLAVIPELWSRR